MTAHIRHIIKIDSPPEVVYEALTTQRGIQGWWTHDTIIEPVVGSTAEFIFGERYHNKMEITELQVNRCVAWYCKQGDPEWIGTDFTFDLEDKGEQTLLRFGQNNWREPTDFYAYCNINWANYMQSLKDYCETGKGAPFGPSDDNIKLAGDYMQIWNSGQEKLLDTYGSDEIEVAYTHFEKAFLGKEEYKSLLRMTHSFFPDLKISLNDIVQADKQRVIVDWEYAGTHKNGYLFGAESTGKKVRVRGLTILTIESGCVIKETGIVDNLSLLTQLGIIKS